MIERGETQNWDHRLPGGKVFDSLKEYLAGKEKGDSYIQDQALLAAQKELSEETSLRLPIESFKPLGRSIAGATVVWDLHYYVANVPKQKGLPSDITTDEGEQTRPQWFTYEEVETLCLDGNVQEDRSVATLLRYLLRQKS